MRPRVLIIGASLAGLRSAEAVLTALPEAQVTLAGDEAHAPYNRPPLSKEALTWLVAGDAALEKLAFRHRLAEGAVDWRLGVRAEATDAQARTVRLSDGTVQGYDWLIAATGLRPRRMALPYGEGRHVLRTWEDAARLALALRPGARMAVVGAGFIGCEVAATAVKLGLSATVIEPQAQPMLAALGSDVAAAMAAFHRAHGVDLRCGLMVTGAEKDVLILSDGSRLEGDVIVEAVGSIPNVDWLEDTGLDLSNGILCDETLTARGSDRILAVGDVARFPNALFDAMPRRVEHWSIPGLTAKRAAETIAMRVAGAEPPARFAPLPSFWSDQHGLRLQSFGAPGLGDEIRVLEGTPARLGDTPCLIEYRRAGKMVGILGLGAAPAMLAQHRVRLERELNETVAA
ncbi:MAG: FAD-dependent oxidoreductase [Tabrizicola sp.]|jgi:NADPH-dependent 2,4-dienoyl-CoA reductase/sulfur reductase-like enzyme|nr:FAD-dependent oxidoreductase [Tabrizicola sp.]